jgi:hypothetical protein
MEVMRMTHRWARTGSKSPRRPWIAVLILLLVAVPALAQEEPVVQRMQQTLILFQTAADLPALVRLVVALDQLPDLHGALFEGPRDYLASQSLAPSIALAPDAFQITAVDFSIVPENPEEAWFGIAEPLEGLVFEPKGVGIFYRSVGMFIQEAREPVAGETAGGMGASDGISIQQIEDMLALINQLSPETLNNLRTAMKELNKLPIDSPERASFLHNPREYLLGRELTLPASKYRIVAMDFDRAASVEAVKSDRIRAGLAVIPEGIGVFGTEVGIFLQLAI